MREVQQYHTDPLFRITEAPSGREDLARITLRGGYTANDIPPLLTQSNEDLKKNKTPLEFVARHPGTADFEAWVFTTDGSTIDQHIADIAGIVLNAYTEQGIE